ncbi:MAG: 50S ribosomal protein L21 [Candidatus Kaiserbacteria bacterium]|nr:50S ribosomal protein L21 [Candidatus Kaiserbacteria bacterium]
MSKFAVIETGGKQYAVNDGDCIDIELLKECKEGDTISFDKVLLFDDGAKTDVGMPYLEGRKVSGTVETVGRHKKVSVVRFRAKSNYRRHYGHRQPFCKVRITSIA